MVRNSVIRERCFGVRGRSEGSVAIRRILGGRRSQPDPPVSRARDVGCYQPKAQKGATDGGKTVMGTAGIHGAEKRWRVSLWCLHARGGNAFDPSLPRPPVCSAATEE